jgi:hypothetical protein
MVRPGRTAGAASLLVALGLIGGSGAAYARTGTPHARNGFAPVQGVVSALSTGSMQVTTASGSVTVSLATTTRVSVVNKVTTSALTQNARVELHLVSGTTTVDAVSIEPSRANRPTPKPTTRPTTHPTRPTRTGTGAPRARTHVGGQFVGISGNTITIRTPQGQTASYTLAPNASVTQTVKGQVGDLKIGKTVQVFARSGVALAITIFNS